MGSMIGLWLGVLLAGLAIAWLLLYRPFRQYIEEIRFGNARVLFRQRREWLEVHFLRALGEIGTEERTDCELLFADVTDWYRDLMIEAAMRYLVYTELMALDVELGADEFLEGEG